MDTCIHADTTPQINLKNEVIESSEALNSGRFTRHDSVFPLSCNKSVLCMKCSSTKQVRWVQGKMFSFSRSTCFELRCLEASGSKCRVLY